MYDMYELPEKYPDLHQYFISGFLTVSRSKPSSTFNCVSTDIAVKEGIYSACVSFIYWPKVFIRSRDK